MASAAQIAQIMALVESGIPLDQIPAGRPPVGQVSHIHNAVGRTHMITTCDIICIIIVCTVVAMRFYTRIHLLKNLWWDDCKSSSAMTLRPSADRQRRVYIVRSRMLARRDRTIPIRLQVRSRQAHLRHYCRRPLPQSTTWLGCMCGHVQHHYAFLQVVNPIALPPCIPDQQLCQAMVGCRRLHSSILSRSYIRVLVPMQTNGICLVSQHGKRDRSHSSNGVYRSLTITPEYCISTEKFYTANAALNVVSDIMILLLPVPIVWSLNTDLRKKVILTGLFSMGKRDEANQPPKLSMTNTATQDPSLALSASSACAPSSSCTSLATTI